MVGPWVSRLGLSAGAHNLARAEPRLISRTMVGPWASRLGLSAGLSPGGNWPFAHGDVMGRTPRVSGCCASKPVGTTDAYNVRTPLRCEFVSRIGEGP
eukprot:CAMPEP_0180135614 /NCGR_PEP_ID=MMETSP0986-20121125/10949_1 /TAXON_ID=697907 /ORGANISM="non described non described, Strain CCMP2293" /LENGTH=97 /DNA_ID=CAMNT_0022076373 /DNA_START=26 /DNA_END=316 /DNA_ORIENTATION=+